MFNIITTKTTHLTRISTIALLALGLLSATPAAAQSEVCDEQSGTCYQDEQTARRHETAQYVWNTVGAAGAVDENSLGTYTFQGSDAFFRANKTGSVILRYPVSCDLDSPTPAYFRIRYKDNGSNARVQLKLVGTPFSGGDQKVLGEFDSNTRSSSEHFQSYVGGLHKWENGSARIVGMNCGEYAWHYEVRLTRRSGGDARLRMIGLDSPTDLFNVFE